MNRVRAQIECTPYINKEVLTDRQSKNISGNKRIKVAVLDTGTSMHPDLQGNILQFIDFVNLKTTPYDDNGHGTHVCGILAGTGMLSAGKYQGIAPNAGIIVLKVLDKKGDGDVDTMINAIEWLLKYHELYNIRIVNISVGTGQMMNEVKEERLRNKLEELWNAGMLVVCAAGNNGPSENSLSHIVKSPYLITVGCNDGEYFKDMEDRCALHSARGERFSMPRKPDLVAPGTHIVSCNAFCKKTKYGFVNAYSDKSGTSMATPIVSGALALLLEKEETCNKETAKRKLFYAATDLYEPWHQQGWGMVNIKRLLE